MSRAVCEICAGKGRVTADAGRYLVKCLPCNGTGKKKWKTKRCEACQGQGFNQGSCTECMGTGELVDESA